MNWKIIPEFGGIYEVSDAGWIKSRTRFGERVFGPRKNPDQYWVFRFWLNGKVYPIQVHQVVAKHFIPNPENKPQINHNNFDRSDNRVENLEWVTPRENQIHAVRGGRTRTGVRHHSSKLSPDDFIKIKKHLSESILTMREIAEIYGVSVVRISSIFRGKDEFGNVFTGRRQYRSKNGHKKTSEFHQYPDSVAVGIHALLLEGYSRQRAADKFGVGYFVARNISNGKRKISDGAGGFRFLPAIEI